MCAGTRVWGLKIINTVWWIRYFGNADWWPTVFCFCEGVRKGCMNCLLPFPSCCQTHTSLPMMERGGVIVVSPAVQPILYFRLICILLRVPADIFLISSGVWYRVKTLGLSGIYPPRDSHSSYVNSNLDLSNLIQCSLTCSRVGVCWAWDSVELEHRTFYCIR